jgi:hypothetical protein
MEKHLHNVEELAASTRSVVEDLMGRPLRDDEQVYIVAIERGADPSIDQRKQAWGELNEILAEIREHVTLARTSTADVERTIDEECHDVRYGNKPCG